MPRSPTAIYLTFWTTGCAVGFGAGVLVLRARRALSLATVTALLVAWGGFVIGSKGQARLETDLPVWQALLVPGGEVLEAGRRIPLGLLAGALIAGLWCVVFRAPWRETGDALAVAASTLIPI